MIETQGKKQIQGITRGAFPWWILNQAGVQKSLVLTSDEDDVLDLVDDFNALLRLPSSWKMGDHHPIVGLTVDDEPTRQVSLHQWLFGKAEILVASCEGIQLSCDDLQNLRNKSFLVKPGLRISRPAFEDKLMQASYSRAEYLEQVGEYAIRGDVIDIWIPGEEAPFRLTWNVDEVESIGRVNFYTQRSESFQRQMILYPVKSGTEAKLLDVIPADVQRFVFVKGANYDVVPEALSEFEAAWVDPSQGGENDQGTLPPPSFGGHIHHLKEQLIQWHEQDWDVVIFCHNQGERDRLDELLEDREYGAKGLKAPWLPPIVIGNLEHGFLHSKFRKAVLSNSEIFGRYRKRVRLPKFETGQTLSSAMDVRPQDFLVHEKHGVGRYMGLKSLKVGKITSEFMAIEYKGGDKIYVPIFELQQVQKYMGAEGKRPPLSSLDTSTWERVKSKVKEDIAKLAADLIQRAAKRQARAGYAFPSKTHLEEEFANSFLYELTEDQKKSWDEVQQDMESTKAMDRLLCGDVGYGKTEIAMRAALKCALAGKQVSILCPTTILAEQHYRNFQERLAEYPVTTALLSRFQHRSQQKKVLETVAQGGTDIVIGTHRLLSKDVVFKNCGLLVIDEEHRFGVKQKNKLLALRETVDVLSLTATPIPRTLASSMGGIKELSLIETAPRGRLPIGTHVGLFNEDVMAKAVQSELDRGGQVFYVHNRVKTLLSRKEWLISIMPQLRVVMAHGQMKEDQLETAMHDFLHRKVDVLLATTIIESGLDIPSVNTLIVEEADAMGLAQLYQLRGRVGRSSQRAYCYLFYQAGGMTSEARKRLDALKEFTALGSGFRLAMRDMEIRGAGNLLGPQQHGNMAAVGLETYSRLLNEQIHRLKGEEADDKAGPAMEVSISAYIPEDYLPVETERIQTYKRILNANKEELGKLKDELIDRCGPFPEPVKTLFDAAALRNLLKAKGISEVHQEMDSLLFYFNPRVKLSETSYNILVSQNETVLSLVAGDPPGVRFFFNDNEEVMDALGRFLRLIFPH